METTKNNKRVAVVSGGAGYLGSAVVKKLAEDDMVVALLCRDSSKEKADEIVNSLYGEAHKVYVCNLENNGAVENIFSTIESELGDIYAVVHTAGAKPQRKQLTASLSSDMDEQYTGTILPAFNFLTAGAKKLKVHKEGILIGVTTIGVVLPEATRMLGTYIPAKYAVEGMLAVLKEELKESNTRVYSIAPGFMAGGMNANIPKAFVQMIEAKSPTKTLASNVMVAERISDICKQEGTNNEALIITIAPEYGM